MKLENLSKPVREEAIEGLYKTLSDHCTKIVKVVGGESYSIIRRPRKVGFTEYPFFMAADMDKLFQFALGEIKASASYIGALCDNIEEMLTTTPAGARVDLDRATFGSTPLGLAVHACRARVLLREGDDADLMTEDDVVLLSSIPRGELLELELHPHGKSTPPQYQIDDVRKLFERENVAI